MPRAITPLSWTFRDIIAAFNNFPALNELYSFRDAIGPFPLGNARRVLLSGMYLTLKDVDVDVASWGMPTQLCCSKMTRTFWSARDAR